MSMFFYRMLHPKRKEAIFESRPSTYTPNGDYTSNGERFVGWRYETEEEYWIRQKRRIEYKRNKPALKKARKADKKAKKNEAKQKERERNARFAMIARQEEAEALERQRLAYEAGLRAREEFRRWRRR